MSEARLLTESLGLAQNKDLGVAQCKNVGGMKNAGASKAQAFVSQDDTGRQTTFSKSRCSVEQIQRNSAEILSSVANSASDPQDRETLDCNAGLAAETRTKVLQGQTLSKFFENEYFKIQRSETAGLGAVATKNLKQGDVILRERPLFTANASNVFGAYEKLTCHDKDVAMSLHANALLKPGTPRIQAIWKTNW
ncbi:hypothetical protein E4U21_007150 [Claviceps maximensis]|nr:hypothetical protein E4U21_007150 [Claviceps maximensis]